MKNVELFIEAINDACDDGKHWVRMDIDNLRCAEIHMTDEELLELDRVLGEGDIDQLMADLGEIYDCGEPENEVAPIVQGAYEWLVGPFEVSHKDYDPYWWRSK